MRIQRFWRQHRVPALTAALMLVVLVAILAVGQRLPQWLGGVRPEALIIIGIAVFFMWIAVWRGQQAQERLEETGWNEWRKIREAQKQTGDQNFNSALSMATDTDSPSRTKAGFTRLSQLYEGTVNNEEAEKYLHATQTAAKAIMEREYEEGAEGRNIPSRARKAALKFLIRYPLAEWEESQEWRLGGYDLSHLNLGMLLNESLQHDIWHGTSRQQWKVVATVSNCEKIHTFAADLSNADFKRADLTGAHLWHSNLTSVDLSFAKLTSADLSSANLSDANLTHARLGDADLTKANFRSANLWAVTFRNTRVDRADFRGIRIIAPYATEPDDEKPVTSSEVFRGCCWDQSDDANKPLLPEGIDPYDLDDIPREDDSAE